MGNVLLKDLEAQIAMSLCESPELRKKFHGRLTARVQFIEKFSKKLSVSSDDNCTVSSTDTVDSEKYGFFPRSRYEMAEEWKEEYGPEFYSDFSYLNPDDTAPDITIGIDNMDATDTECVFLITVRTAGVNSAFMVWMYGNSSTVSDACAEIEKVVLQIAGDLICAGLK